MNKEKDDLLDDLSVPSYGCDPKSIELFRRVEDLKIKYDNARLFRLMSEYYDSFNILTPESSNFETKKDVQSAYLNTSIIWYNNCIDAILQILWLYHEVYKSDTKNNINNNPEEWNEKKFENLLKSCKYDTFSKWANDDNNNIEIYNKVKSLYYSTTIRMIRTWANTIKHKSIIHIRGTKTNVKVGLFYYEKPEFKEQENHRIQIDFQKLEDHYDSSTTTNWYDAEEIIEILKNANTEIVNAVKELIYPIIN